MKASKIMERATILLRIRLNQGWLMDWGNPGGSNLYWGVNLIKGGEKQELYVKQEVKEGDGWEISVMAVRCRQTSAIEKTLKTAYIFYKIADDWYTESESEALAALKTKVKRMRGRWQVEKPFIAIKPTPAFMRHARQHKGFSRVKMTDITITRRPKYYAVYNDKNGRSYAFNLPAKGGKK